MSADLARCPCRPQVPDENTMRSISRDSRGGARRSDGDRLPAYQAGRYPEVEVLCRGSDRRRPQVLVVVFALRARRCAASAGSTRRSTQLEQGLVYEPDEPKLLLMRSELRDAVNNTAHNHNVKRRIAMSIATSEIWFPPSRTSARWSRTSSTRCCPRS